MISVFTQCFIGSVLEKMEQKNVKDKEMSGVYKWLST